jgi:hypothetical protein
MNIRKIFHRTNPSEFERQNFALKLNVYVIIFQSIIVILLIVIGAILQVIPKAVFEHTETKPKQLQC